MEVCERCIATSELPSFEKYSSGCSFCVEFEERLKDNSKIFNQSQQLDSFIQKIKKNNLNKSHDCIVGLSGGVDSAWALLQAKKLGLRPLAVHMDNGWNSELAQNNIQVLLEYLDVDLYTYVIDWDEYRSLMNAFFKANVIDIELLMDNAMLAVNYNMAHKLGLKTILTGSNSATEGIRMPPGWIWHKFDKKNIKSIAKYNGIKRLKSFPSISNLQKLYYERVRGIRWISFLDYFDYSREKALVDLQSIGFKPYPFKHYESVFTRFYQAYILPRKFGVDKRIIHLSAQIVSNEITREEALERLKASPYLPNQENEDISYFLSKMEWTKDQLDSYIKAPVQSHSSFDSEGRYADDLLNWIKIKLSLKNVLKK